MTCTEIEALLAAGGRAAIDASGEAQAHIGECEACAERLIAFEESAASASSTTSAWPELEAPAAPPSAAPPAPSPEPAAPAPPPPPLPQAPAAEAPAPAPPLVPPPRPPSAAPPVVAASGGAPLAPPKPQPMDWLPSLSSVPKGGPWQGLARRASLKIRPVHFWIGSLVSALVGGVLVLVVVLVVTRERAPEPQMELVAVEDQPEFGEAVLDELVPVPREPVARVKAARPGAKHKLRGKGAADEPPGEAVVIPPPGDKPLPPSEVSAGIKANLGKLGPCFAAARKRRETIPGKHTLVFDFVIQPSGAVKEGALTGPDYLVKTKLGACLGAKLKSWRFPPSGAGTPVRNLQLPITVK